jgi:hypothetical protein
MSQQVLPSRPYAAAMFADCLFNTDLLPPTVQGPLGPAGKQITGSTNGYQWFYSDPENQAVFIQHVNSFFSQIAYGVESGFKCVGADKTVAGPCRYVVMHTSQPAPNPYSQAAHQLLVNADGTYTYIDTTWTDVNTQA